MFQWFERVAPAVMCALFVVAAVPGGGAAMAFRLGWVALGAAVIAAIVLEPGWRRNQSDDKTEL